jgi:adenylylsulfate reductase subunit B
LTRLEKGVRLPGNNWRHPVWDASELISGIPVSINNAEVTIPSYVDPNACNACAGVHQGPLCVYICPNNLMVLDPALGKAFNQEPELCSECYACVKLCPEEALHVRGYADFVPLGAEVQPKYIDDNIRWHIRFRDGRELEFTYPSRTTPAGSIDPYKGFTENPVAQLRGPDLAGESRWLGVASLPTLRSHK